MSADNQRRTVWKIVALVLRLNCFAMMVGTWRQNLSLESGLVYSSGIAAEAAGACNYSASDMVNVRGFFVARILMAVLMFWELGYVPRLDWDDWAHHVITIVGTIVTADTVANRGTGNPALAAVGFCALFGGAVASFNYWFLLAYQFSKGDDFMQGLWFLCASIFSWSWQFMLFVAVPG
eukprot:SAG31_NODE_16853_length_693_cov_0.781145_1_plen_178_part_10